ncbi:hypothetical protein GF338_05120, partial [candidate division WOR-3 bacterium]|nr:hypothetical protein [candidate division WOR-3 bacterium]
MNLFLILLTFGAIEWTETSFEDFRDGSVDPMCYVSHRAQYETVEGCVEFYARWDADNDGYYDLFVAGKEEFGQRLFMGSQTGYHSDDYIEFNDWTQDAGGADMADLNLDGYPELIHSGGWYAPSIYIYWGTESGPDPSNLTTLNTPNSSQCHETVFTYDIDKDGYLDLTTCGGGNGPNYTRIFWGAPGNPIQYETSNRTDLPSGIGCQHNLEMADLDHDGWVDMVIPNYGTSNASIVHFQEEGDYTIETLDLSPLSRGLHGTTLADFDGDEWLDIVFTGWNSVDEALIYWGGPDGYHQDSTTLLYPGTCYGGSSSMDINNDGLLDLVFHRNGSSSTYPLVYYNTGVSPYFWES